MTAQLWAVVLAAGVCGVLGAVVPGLIARIPEPEPDPPSEECEPEERQLFSSQLPAAPPKELYADIAARPRLAVWTTLWSALAGAGLGAAVGWTGALVYLIPLVPVAVALFVIDVRTTLLPSWIIKPAYPVLVLLILVAFAVDRDVDDLQRAGWGWLVVGGWFFGFWVLTGGGGWGYGDVRLSGLLGPALGYVGWTQLLSGLVLIFFVGALGAVATAVVRRTVRARLPYGPYMLVGAWLGIVAGPTLATALGY